MKVLIVAATETEVEPLLKKLFLKKKSGGILKCGKYKNVNVDILIAGIGMVTTTYHCTKVISAAYNNAINLGIAGSFNYDLPIGTVVNVVYDRFSELGSETKETFLTLEELNLIGTDVINDFPEIKNQVISTLGKVKAITVNTIHGDQNSIDRVVRQFNPDIETMEGAAFLFVCKNENIPCAQIRAISNFVETRNIESRDGIQIMGRNPSGLRVNWNVPLAIKNLNEVAFRILDGFNQKRH